MADARGPNRDAKAWTSLNVEQVDHAVPQPLDANPRQIRGFDNHVIVLEPDIATAFASDEAINGALPLLLKAGKLFR